MLRKRRRPWAPASAIALWGVPMLTVTPIQAAVEPISVDEKSVDGNTVETPIESSILTETDLLARLGPDHPALLERRRSRVGVAQGELLAAKAWADPVIDIMREDPDGPTTQLDWTVSWQLPGADRKAHIEAHRLAVDGAEALVANDTLRAHRELRRLYADWAVADARREATAAHVERLDGLARRQENRAASGEASGLEARRLRLAVGVARAELTTLDAAARAARSALQAWLPDLPAGRPALPELEPAPGLEAVHPQEQAARLAVAAAEAELRAAERFVSMPELRAGRQRFDVDPNAGPQAPEQGTLLGVSWTVPLSRNKGERASTQAELDAARHRLELVQRRLKAAAQVAERYRALTVAQRQAAAATQGDDRLLDGAEAAFDYGEVDLTDLLDVLDALRDGRLAALDLHAEALAARADLLYLAGDDGPAPQTQNMSSPSQEQDSKP